MIRHTVHCFTYAMKFANFLKMLMAIFWSNDQATSHDTVVHVVGYGSTQYVSTQMRLRVGYQMILVIITKSLRLAKIVTVLCIVGQASACCGQKRPQKWHFLTQFKRRHFVFHSLPQSQMSFLECSQSVIQWFILFKVVNATSQVSDDQATLQTLLCHT